ncbi:MAG: glycerophosphodiester phosphodiesterase, partial [Flavobacteriaceae bacterium]
DDPLDAIPVAKALQAKAINPDFSSLNPNNISKIKSAGLQIFAWTVNKPEDIASLIDLGIDGIITDFPERVPKRKDN